MRLFAFLGILLVLIGLSFASALPAGAISTCTNISYPGYYYQTTDLSGTPITFQDEYAQSYNTCILINASNVVFDCQGGNLYTGDANSETGIAALSIKNVTIENCNIQNLSTTSYYPYGVFLDNATHSYVTNNEVTNIGTGFYTESSKYNLFNGNYLVIPGDGFDLYDSSHNTLVNNTISGEYNDGSGIYLSNSSSNNLTNDTISMNYWGVYFDTGSDYNYLLESNITDNDAGFYVWYADSNQIGHNFIYDTYDSNLGFSCPFTYAWNGTGYTFVSDISGGGKIGGSKRNITITPWDYSKISGSQLQPANGVYTMQITEEYNEISYLDELDLMTVDHSPTVDIYPGLAIANASFPYTVSKTPSAPVSCTDSIGRDCLPTILKKDGVFTDNTTGTMTLNLGDLSGASDIKLIVTEFHPSGFPIANATSRSFQVKDSNGQWADVYTNAQLTSSGGMPKTYVLDLTGKFVNNDYSVRIVAPSLAFDYIAVDTTPQQPVTINKYSPVSADLHYRGYSNTHNDFAHTPDYNNLLASLGYTNDAGNFTRYGDVLPLLQSTDDEYVIMNHGDEISVSFPFNPVPDGQSRDFLLYSYDYFKRPTDTNGTTVTPLPFQAMTAYPYPASESYPADSAHQDYLATYDTRSYNASTGGSMPYSYNNTVFNNTIIGAPWSIGLFLQSEVDTKILYNNITDVGTGILLQNSTGTVIEGNNIMYNNYEGIYVEGMYSEGYWNFSNDNLIADNNISNNGYEGIYLDWSSYDTNIKNNNISNNNYEGIYVDDSFLNSIDNNTVEFNGADCQYNDDGTCYYDDDGIELTDGSFNNTVAKNDASNNAYNGIGLYGTHENSLNNNSANWNGWDGLYMEGYCRDCSYNNITNSFANNNYYSGYELYYEDNNNLINDTAIENEYSGFVLEGGSYLNFLSNDTAINDSIGFPNCFGYQETSGFIIDSSNNNTIVNSTSHDNYQNCSNIRSLGSSDIKNYTAKNKYALEAANTTQPNRIPRSFNEVGNGFSIGEFQYTGNYDDNILANDNAYNDGYNGYWIYGFCNDCGSFNNITNSNASNNLLAGFELTSEDNDNLINDLAFDNQNVGFLLDSGSNANLLDNDTAINNSASTIDNCEQFTETAGFVIDSSYNNTIVNSKAHDNTAFCNIPPSSVDSNSASRFTVNSTRNHLNQLDTWNMGDGFAVGQFGYSFYRYFYSIYGNVLGNDKSYYNGGDGFWILGYNLGSFNNVTNSVAYNNSWAGFELTHDDNDNFTGNNAHDNQLAGFLLDDYSHNNYFQDNIAYNDVGNLSCISDSFFMPSGFALDNSPDNTFVNSISTGNNFNCTNFFGGTSVTAPKDIRPTDGMKSNLGAGVSDVDYSYNNNFTGLTSDRNGFAGIFLDEDNSDSISDATVFANPIYGFTEYTDSAPASITDSSFFGNGWEIAQESPSGTFTMTNVTVGDLPYVQLSLNDTMDGGGGYLINDTTAPAPLPQNRSSFFGEYYKILFAPGESIDNLTFFWNFQWSQYVVPPALEQSITAFTWNASGNDTWVYTEGQTLPDNSTHSLSVLGFSNYTTDDVYALSWNYTKASSTGGQPPVYTGYLVLSKQAVCPGNLLNVTVSTSDHGPAAGASVTVYENGNPVATGSTGPDGSVSLTLPASDSYTVNATYGSYQAIGQDFRYALCAGTPACSSDNDCPADQRCQVNDNPSLNKCVPVQCQCGQSVQNHTCVGQVYQCGSGSNCNACPNGEVCGDNHQCKQVGCTSDGQCKDNEACKTATGAPGTTTTPGACQPLCPDGSSSCSCGQATNHTLVPYGYECGSEPGCPQCQSGFTCNSDHKCVQGDINCPSTAIVGDQKNCQATQNGQPLGNCSVTVTDPSGKTYTEACDPSGNLQTPPLTIQGLWTVTLVQNGTAVKTVQINALPKSAPSEQPSKTAPPPFDLGSLLWLLVLLVIIIAAVLYWRSRGKKK